MKRRFLEDIRALLKCGYDPTCREDEWDNHGPLLVDVLDSERRTLFMEFGARPRNRRTRNHVLGKPQ